MLFYYLTTYICMRPSPLNMSSHENAFTNAFYNEQLKKQNITINFRS